jgi:hypothetical protein
VCATVRLFIVVVSAIFRQAGGEKALDTDLQEEQNSNTLSARFILACFMDSSSQLEAGISLETLKIEESLPCFRRQDRKAFSASACA